MTHLAIVGCDTGIFTCYERAVGLSNGVRRLARVIVPEWDEVRAGKVPIDSASLQHFREHPEDYQTEPEPEDTEPRVA